MWEINSLIQLRYHFLLINYLNHLLIKKKITVKKNKILESESNERQDFSVDSKS